MTLASTAAANPPATPKALPPRLEKALAAMTEICSPPEVTTKIVELVEDPGATAHDMHRVVRTDPALAAKILKVVNSAFYGLPARIASLDRAILMLGLSAVKNIALAASLSHLFKAGAVSAEFAARDLWRHCVAVGVCARLLANAAKSAHVDEAFVAGLVHDMGLIAAQQILPAQVRRVVETCHHQAQSFCTVEDNIIGADHQAFGGTLAARWRFPLGLRHALAYHHHPVALQPEFRKMAALIYVADTLCCRARYGFWLTAQTQEIDDWMLPLIGLSPADLERVAEEWPARVAEAEQVFGD